MYKPGTVYLKLIEAELATEPFFRSLGALS